MSLTPWRTYVVVCRTGSLSAAAAELDFTQSAVSRQIAALETEAGLPLLERRARGVVPTAAGEEFLLHATVVVNAAARAFQAASEAETGGAPIVVGATPSTAAGLVPPALSRLRAAGGTPRWSLVPGLSPALTRRVAAGELDLAVVTDAPPGVPESADVRRVLLGADEMRVAVPTTHRLASRRRRVQLERFADEVWVEDDEGSATLLRTFAARAGFAPRIDLDADDLTSKIAFVAAGHAVALVPGIYAATLRSDVSHLALTDPPRRAIYALLPADGRREHPSTPDLVDALRVVCGSLGHA